MKALGLERAAAHDAAILACVNAPEAGRLDEALHLLREMAQAGFEAAIGTFNALLAACDRASRPDDALRLLGEMEQAGHPPGAAAYDAAISACIRSEAHADRALSLLHEAQGANVYKSGLGLSEPQDSLSILAKDIHQFDPRDPNHPIDYRRTVPPGVATALFESHSRSRKITHKTIFILGEHEDDKPSRDAVRACMEAREWTPREVVGPDGVPDPGRAIALEALVPQGGTATPAHRPPDAMVTDSFWTGDWRHKIPQGTNAFSNPTIIRLFVETQQGVIQADGEKKNARDVLRLTTFNLRKPESSWMHALNALENLNRCAIRYPEVAPDFDIYKSVVFSLSKGRKAEAAMKVLREMKEERGLKPARDMFERVLFVDAGAGRVENTLDMVGRMKALGFEPDAGTWERLITVRLQAGKLDDALRLVHLMGGLGFAPAQRVYDTLLEKCRGAGDLDRAADAVDAMSGHGLAPSGPLFNRLIIACDGFSKPEAALRLVRQMGDAGLQPSFTALNAAISVCIRSGGHVDQVPHLLERGIGSVFQEELGFFKHPDRDDSILSMTIDDVYVGSHSPRGRAHTVEPNIAKALYDYHWGMGHLTSLTTFKFGDDHQRLSNLVRNREAFQKARGGGG
ncbi:MAG: hypothetical protein ABW032_09155 [Burkholderiaceae bacterium]